MQSNLYRKLNKAAANRGYHLVLFSGTYDKFDADQTTPLTSQLYALAENMEFVAFFIHVQSIGNPEMIHQVIEMGKRKNIPIFAYDCESAGITSEDGVITINPDYKQGFAESVKHIIEHHHCRNIFMLAGMRNNKYSDDRIAMYREQMETHGIPYVEEQIGYGDFWETPATIALEKVLDSDLPTPEAICCANDSMAIIATRVLARRGYRVPEDILVTGFDGIEDGKYNLPTISTCEPKLDILAKFIFDSIEGKDTTRDYLIPLQFDAKESCGCGFHNDMEDRRVIANLIDNSRHIAWVEHMMNTMEVDLIDSCSISEIATHMIGALELLPEYYGVYCVRDDLEVMTDYTEPLDKLRVHLNYGLLPEDKYDAFSVEKVLPDLDAVIEKAAPGEIFCMRLIHCADRIYGYNVIKTANYRSNEMRLLAQMVERFTYVTESILRNKRLKLANQKLSEMYDRMSEIYVRDTLTGLNNRHGYYQDMEEYIKRDDIKNGYLQIVSIDMDGMKHINDNYGHMEGDNAIKAVARAIKDCFAQPCISARFGGDEFVVALFTEDDQEPTAEKISAKLHAYLKTMPLLADKEYTVGVSVGRAVAKISEISDLKMIEKLADDQMYINKRQRKGKNIR
ncbi:MAG: GGDEF domain-containing protein [Acetatifactor sp.]|nr:GGDEF domain-containing protein [Acetatifactor sp.]